MKNWVEILKETCEKSQKEKLYWVARGCCTEQYRKKCVERGLVPAEVVPMNEEDKEKFKLEIPMLEIKPVKIEPKKAEGITSGKEFEEKLQRLSREQFKLKLLADVGADIEVCKLMGSNPLEFINEIIELLKSFIKDKE